MKLRALLALVACLTGAATYYGATAFGSSRAGDTTPSALEFARALSRAANQVRGGSRIAHAHCVKASPGHYMCAYAVVKPAGSECHLLQAEWTPGEASTITVTLAGRAGRCDSVRAAIQSLG